MKKFLSITLILFLVGSFLYLVDTHVQADVGEGPTEGGTITPGDKTVDIEMTSERVVYDVKIDDENSPFDDWYQDYVHVTAQFAMKNTSTSVKGMNVIFPVPCFAPNLEYFNADYEGNQSLNFEVFINDTSVTYEYAVYDMQSFREDPLYGEQKVLAIKFPVNFVGESITNIKVEYDARLVFEPKSMYGTFLYIMETGSHWSGEIGSGEIIFKFPFEIDEEIFLEYNSFFNLEDNQLVWKFSNLEPDHNYNIRITFAPELVGVWNDRDKELESITSPNEVDQLFIYANDDLSPVGKYSESLWGSYESHPFFLTQSEAPEEVVDHNGWFVKMEGDEIPTVNFEFDAVYKLAGMDLFTGIPYFTHTNGEAITLYNVFDRPKDLLLTFSDGTSQTITLIDDSDTMQSVSFDEVETSSVKVEVMDTFLDYILDEHYIGIARMNFDIGEKVREKDIVQVDDEDTDQVDGEPLEVEAEVEKSWLERNLLLIGIILGGVVLLMIGGGVFVYKLRKKAHKKSTESSDEVNLERQSSISKSEEESRKEV